MVSRYILPAAVIAVAFFLLAGFFPAFGSSEFMGRARSISDHYLEESASVVGSVNVVSSIVWVYRGYDTLGEVTILFTTVIAISMLGAGGMGEEQKPVDEEKVI